MACSVTLLPQSLLDLLGSRAVSSASLPDGWPRADMPGASGACCYATFAFIGTDVECLHARDFAAREITTQNMLYNRERFEVYTAACRPGFFDSVATVLSRQRVFLGLRMFTSSLNNF